MLVGAIEHRPFCCHVKALDVDSFRRTSTGGGAQTVVVHNEVGALKAGGCAYRNVTCCQPWRRYTVRMSGPTGYRHSLLTTPYICECLRLARSYPHDLSTPPLNSLNHEIYSSRGLSAQHVRESSSLEVFLGAHRGSKLLQGTDGLCFI